MDKIYITHNLFDFKTKIFPKNCIIINLEKYNKNDFLESLINKIGINDIYCENSSLENYLRKKLPGRNIINIEHSDVKKMVYTDRNLGNCLIYFICASLIIFFLFGNCNPNYSLVIGITLIANLIIWSFIYYFLVKNQPWEPISCIS